MEAYLGIGANLGQRERSVLEALRRIESDAIARVLRTSALYETEAVGMGLAPPFVNAVTQVRSLLSPKDMLIRLKAVESAMGRRGGHNDSREIDIDLIACGRTVMETGELTLPHPRYHERGFVLIPLAEIAPGFVCPRTGLTVEQMIERLTARAGVVRISTRGLIPRATP